MAVESLAWLIARYRESRAWTALAPATRRQRELVFKKVMAGLDRRGATPFAAKTFLKALRGLFRWAAENSLIERDPTEGVRIPLPRTDGSIRGRKTKSRILRHAGRSARANGWR
jgi:site-specific recombinase XerC